MKNKILSLLVIFLMSSCPVYAALNQSVQQMTFDTAPTGDDLIYTVNRPGTVFAGDRKVEIRDLFSTFVTDTGATSLTGLSDVGSATISSGRMLIADGTNFQSVAMSGDCIITSAGVTTCTGIAGATELTGLTDVGSSTVGAGRILINDGTKFQSISVNGDCFFTSSGRIHCSSYASQMTGLSDVGSATISSGSLLVSDGTKFQSVALSQHCFIASNGQINCDGLGAAKTLTGLSDIGSATIQAGRLLVSDGTKYQSVATYYTERIAAASSNTNYPVIRQLPYSSTASILQCCIDSGTSALVTIKQCGSEYPVFQGRCNTVFAQTTCDQDCATTAVSAGASALTGGNDIRADVGTVTGTVNNLSITITGP